MGFHADLLDQSNPDCKVFTRKSVIKLSTFTNRIMWRRYGHYLTLKEVTENGVQVIQNFLSCLLGQLLLRPMDSGACIAMRFPASVLEHVISGTAKFNRADLNKCVNGAMELVKRFTRISLSIFTHAIVSRFKSGKGPSKLIHETTLELLQFVSVALIQTVPYHEWYIGDKHQCQLYCEKCNTKFGRSGNIFKVLVEASTAILYHHGLELTSEKKHQKPTLRE